jgi:hypothetical protein
MSDTSAAPSADRTIRIPQLHQPRWWHRVIRTVLLLLVVLLVVAGIDRPEAAGLFLLPVAIWAVKAVGRRPIRLDATTGRLTFPHHWAGRHHASLAGGVELVDDGRQALVLQVGGDPRARVPILRLTRAVRRSQPPDILRALAGQLDRHAPGWAPVAGRLRTQADFLAGGGRPLDSPLAGSIRYSSRWTGVGGGLSNLLDTLLPGR